MTSSTVNSVLVRHSTASRFLDGERESIVYLPASYFEQTDARFPVLYLQDGQNLFDPATAFANQDWRLGSILDELIAERVIDPIIVVGVYNAREDRISEYSHVRNRHGNGGRARRYAKFLAEDLKPFMDGEYRTQPDKLNTGIGGSSLGGLVSFYIGLHYPDLFGKLIIMSPSIWWANRAILRETRRLQGKTDQKIWLDIGTSEGDQPEVAVQDARDLRDVLIARGWTLGQDLRFVEDQGAGHDEKAWGFRMRDALKFHFSASRTQRSPEIDANPELQP